VAASEKKDRYAARGHSQRESFRRVNRTLEEVFEARRSIFRTEKIEQIRLREAMESEG
jgi:hypothetical protein